MNLEGVSYLSIDHKILNREKYEEILKKLLDYTREHLSTKEMARYILKSVNYDGWGKILYLSNDPYPDYLRCLILNRLKRIVAR